MNKIKNWKTYGYWKEHKEFFEKEKDIKKILEYVFNILEDKRAFHYNWVSNCNRIALNEVLKESQKK